MATLRELLERDEMTNAEFWEIFWKRYGGLSSDKALDNVSELLDADELVLYMWRATQDGKR